MTKIIAKYGDDLNLHFKSWTLGLGLKYFLSLSSYDLK